MTRNSAGNIITTPPNIARKIRSNDKTYGINLEFSNNLYTFAYTFKDMLGENYQEILNRDIKLASFFISKELAGVWISVIKGQIARWVEEQHDKGLWELVRQASKDRYITTKNHKLPRRLFAQMLVTFCGEVLKEDETAAKIQSSMEHYKYATQLSAGTIPYEAQVLIGVINNFFNGATLNTPKESQAPTLASRLEDYIRGIAIDCPAYPPFQHIRINPDYGNGVTPSLSIEEYQNEKFYNLKQPSTIVAYKCIDGELDRKSLNDYYVTYKEHRNLTKLYIVGKYHLKSDVFQRAQEIGVGYVYINPEHEMTRDSYELPRSVGDLYSTHRYIDMVLGRIPIQQQLIVCDNHQVTASLSDSLHSLGVAVRKSLVLKAPKLAFKDIEAWADEMTKTYVDGQILMANKVFKQLNGHLYRVESKLEPVRKDGHSYIERRSYKFWYDFSIDPFSLAREDGLLYEYQDLPDYQLGRFDLAESKVLLSHDGLSNVHRLRFTMAHEYAHYKLHESLLQSHNVHAFGDTADTINEMVTIRDDDRKWLERQANHFASCLLMPAKLVGTLFSVLHKEFVQDVYGDKLGPIYYDENQPETFNTYNSVVGGMAEMLNVSKEAMKLRLKRLELCNERNNLFRKSFRNAD